jgi:hypothetical protein
VLVNVSPFVAHVPEAPAIEFTAGLDPAADLTVNKPADELVELNARNAPLAEAADMTGRISPSAITPRSSAAAGSVGLTTIGRFRRRQFCYYYRHGKGNDRRHRDDVGPGIASCRPSL